MCGLFGFSGKKGKSTNIEKLIILGLYNEERGKDSCGYYFNGNIVKGVNQEAKFSNFVTKNGLVPGNLKTKVFMGHTRKSTSGAHTMENAHPHIVNGDYVQTHNGKINNVWTMCSKYDIKSADAHVDSIGLARLISKLGPKKVLEEYTGYAALAFTWLKHPEALWLYHGASKEHKDGNLITERPLYVLYQPEGLYYSSTYNSLETISSDGTDPLLLKVNKAVQIIDGQITGRISIDREERNIIVTPVYTTPKSVMRPVGVQSIIPFTGNRVQDDDEDDGLDPIHSETIPTPSDNDINQIYYFQGRYYIAGREISYMSYHVGIKLMDGEYIINRDSKAVSKPVNAKLNNEDRERWYYFINGIMMKDIFAYNAAKVKKLSGASDESFLSLSSMSKYPIIQLKGVKQPRWFHNGNVVRSQAFRPKFTNKKVRIQAGRTKDIYENPNAT